MKEINGYQVEIFRGTGKFRIINPRTGSWQDYSFGNESPQTYEEVEYQMDSYPELYDSGSMSPEEKGHALFVEKQLKREEEHERCPSGKHWVSGFSRTTNSYGNAEWVRGHCARDPKKR